MKAVALLLLACASGTWALTPATFHKDVEPILQRHCQGCHHPGDIAPMPLVTYEQSRPWAKAIRSAVVQKKMPPWFADPAHGKFLNDESLTKAELDTLSSWVEGGAQEGNPADAPRPREFAEGWHIGKPDAVITIPKAFQVPAKGTIPYQYILVPTNFTEDKWVQAVEVRPSNRKVVHHIIASSSAPTSGSARNRPPGGFFTFDIEKSRVASLKPGDEPPQFSAGPESELLQVFVPGGQPPELKPGQAKLIKAGSNIMFQLHYTAIGTPEEDQTSVGFIFAKEPPRARIKGILVFNTHFTIPAGESNHMLGARAEVLHDMKMVSMLPHMHLRGKDFQFRAIYPSGESEVLLSVPKYDFNWQINYYLAKPKLLPKGTIIECTGHYDNSVNNAFNPDPKTDVHYGEQTWEEMLNGFMEVAIEPTADTPPLLGPGPGPFLPVNATADAKPASPASAPVMADKITFHKNVEPILQEHCQTCHRPGEVAPMPLLTYSQARPWAKAIRAAVLQKQMPPWFADPAHGKFANDRRLSAHEIDILTKWADSGAFEGSPSVAPRPVDFADGWTIGKPDMVIEMSKPFTSKATGDMPYQYILVPSGLTEDKWVEAAEIRPGNRNIVHHVIAFALDPKKNATARGKVNEFLNAEAIAKALARKPGAPEPAQFSSGVDSESLGVYVPGYMPPVLPDNQARLLKAGSVILFQLHYTSSGKAESDVTRVGIRFAKHPPQERVKMVNVQNFAFSIPPNVDNYPITARAELTQDVKLISLQPHMHLRGKTFEYRATYPSGETEVLLSLPRWDFNWQLTYVLAEPKILPKGTIIEVAALFDNSVNNRFNPDPNAEVLYGEQTWNEMMGGLMDVAIAPGTGDPELFKSVPKKASETITTAAR